MSTATKNTQTEVLAPKFTTEYNAARKNGVQAGRAARVATHTFMRAQFDYIVGAGAKGKTKPEQTGLIRAAIMAVSEDFAEFRIECGVSQSTAGVEKSRIRALYDAAIMGDDSALKYLAPLKGQAVPMPLQTWYDDHRPGRKPKAEKPEAPKLAPTREELAKSKGPQTSEPAQSVTVDADPTVAIANAFDVAKDAVLTLRTLHGRKQLDILRGLVEEYFALNPAPAVKK